MSTRNISENLADHIAVQQVINRYSCHLNQREWEQLWSLFSDDGEWNVADFDGNRIAFTGKEQIIAGLTGITSPAELLVQIVHSSVIDVDGDTAMATSTIHETFRSDASQGFTVFGTYYDDFVRCADGEWRFKVRAFRTTYSDMTPPSGDIHARFPLSVRPS